MWLSRFSISNRLWLGYGVLLLLMLGTGTVSIIRLYQINNSTSMLYQHPFAVSNAVREVKINILNIRRYMLNITSATNQQEIADRIRRIDEEEQRAVKNLAIVYDRYLGDKSDIDLLNHKFLNWKPLRDEAINDVANGKITLALQHINNKNFNYVNDLLQQTQTVIDFSSAKAETFYATSQTTFGHTVQVLILIIAISILLSIILSYLITRSITRPMALVVSRIQEVSEGKIAAGNIEVSRDELGRLAQSYNNLKEDLIRKAKVASQIADGNFGVRIPLQSDTDVVAISINKIAENFSQVVHYADNIARGNFNLRLAEYSADNQLALSLSHMTGSLLEVVENARRVAEGDYSGHIVPKSDSDQLAQSLNQMKLALLKMTTETLRQTKIKSAQAELSQLLRGDISLFDIAKNTISYVTRFAEGQLGALYLYNTDTCMFTLAGSYAFIGRKGIQASFRESEGLIGQAATEKQILSFSNLPDDYIHITSGLGSTIPRYVIVAPFLYNGSVVGVLEIGAVEPFGADVYEFLDTMLETLAIAVASALNRDNMSRLLSITKEQAEELQVQQEELKQTNEELESQAQALRKSEEHLQAQQEELRVINEELEEKSKNLQAQKLAIETKNKELETIRANMEEKAAELEITNRYKSEFLANMSHELRTPLNSLLILSQTLADNPKNNLTPDQTEAARIIHNSGNDLLNLINDILDLSKIESGKMTMNLQMVPLQQLQESVISYFRHMTTQKGLSFTFTIDDNLPAEIYTDEMRINQILRNLVSNGIKFTHEGRVDVHAYRPDAATEFRETYLQQVSVVAISVKDTGIGIASDMQKVIFEAFQQADGSISRKYGGTGLGLSITRELVRLLHGEIKIVSEPGKGSEFIVYLPENSTGLSAGQTLPKSVAEAKSKPEAVPIIKPRPATELPVPDARHIADDRSDITKGDNTLLIIEDDARFAEILAGLCRNKGFKCIATATGEDGLELAKKYIPKGIILDINLPGIDGWQVLESIKNNAELRHIPVHIMSGYESTIDAFNRGAIGFLTKPATSQNIETALESMKTFIAKDIKELLIIEDDESLRMGIRSLLSSSDILIKECNAGAAAIELIRNHHYDCVVLDLGLPDMTGFELLQKLSAEHIKIPPVVVYTGREITRDENEQLQRYTQNIIIKGVKSEERLLDETSLFLHRMVDKMPEKQRKMLIHLYDKDQVFVDKTILVVDDDMRNVFALTQVLESARMKVVMAPNGEKALEQLTSQPTIDLVLMDIMMPVLDGYETMKRIRAMRQFERLPVIALTAKAMKEDREKAISSGANDYLSKPVDIQKLFNLMRIWLYQ